nr:MAG TPA: hypothetical protein [Caudoviricetes sp.]
MLILYLPRLRLPIFLSFRGCIGSDVKKLYSKAPSCGPFLFQAPGTIIDTPTC